MPKRPSFILNGLVGTAFIIYDDKLERFDRNNKKNTLEVFGLPAILFRLSVEV
jgi:hypothetical protein